MYQIGEYVVHECDGICQVSDIQRLEFYGKGSETDYYVLIPYGTNNGCVFTPVKDTRVRMRQVMTKEEVDHLIGDIPQIECIREENDKLRTARYKEAINSFDTKRLLGIIKTVYMGRQKRIRSGKKALSGDEKYTQIAEKKLYDELSFIYSQDPEQIKKWITEEINKCS